MKTDTFKEEFNKICAKYYSDGIKHSIRYGLNGLHYTKEQKIQDAVTLAYYEVRDYRSKEKELFEYDTKIFLKYFPDAQMI